MHFVIAALLLLGLLFGPQYWARYTFRRHSRPRDDIPGTGGELAQHLIDRFQLNVTVEPTEQGDHYDPGTRTVRLSPDNYAGRSVTAVAVAAHEVGHALQHHRGEAMLALRSSLVRVAVLAQRIGSVALIGLPVLTALTRAPSVGVLLLLVVVGSIALSALVHFVTLPVEWDASFGKALPILESGYIAPEDRDAVRQVLRAAAFTYVAAALAGLLNLWRWRALLGR